MIFIPTPVKGFKEELLSYEPQYYQYVKEMVAVQEVIALQLEKLYEAFQTIADDSNLTTCSESIIAFYESITGVKSSNVSSLEERRKFIISLLIGNGKLSATLIKQLISYYTDLEVEITFEPYDEEMNNCLYIDIIRSDNSLLYINDIYVMLRRIIPAHILYRTALRNMPCAVVVENVKATSYVFDYELSGTLPDIALLGEIAKISVVVGSNDNNYDYDNLTASENEICGTLPDNTLLGNIIKTDTAVSDGSTNYEAAYKQATDDGSIKAGYADGYALLEESAEAVYGQAETESELYTTTWYLDGNVLLNGSRLLNSIEEEGDDE